MPVPILISWLNSDQNRRGRKRKMPMKILEMRELPLAAQVSSPGVGRLGLIFPSPAVLPSPGLLTHWSSHVQTFLLLLHSSSLFLFLPFPFSFLPFSSSPLPFFPLFCPSFTLPIRPLAPCFPPSFYLSPLLPVFLPSFLFSPPSFLCFSPHSPLPSRCNFAPCACDPPGFALLVCWKCSFYAGEYVSYF